MNLLIITLNYAPEPTGYGRRVALLNEYLVSKGHSVIVLTGYPFMPYWSRYPEYQGQFTKSEHHNGVNVKRLSHFVPSHPKSIVQRLLLEGSFSIMTALVLLRNWQTQWDIVFYIGTHPSVAMIAGIFANIRRLPYVVKITDFASQLASEVGIVKQPWLKNLFSKFEFSAFRRSQGAIILCDGFKNALEANGYPTEQIRVICNSVDLDLIRPINNSNGFRSTNGLSEKDYILLYSGSLSLKQGLSVLIETAAILKTNYPQIKWVIVGDGEQKIQLQRLAIEYDVTKQVVFLPLQPPTEMAAMYSSADILVLPQLAKIKDTVIPGKLITYLAAGRPVLASVNPNNQTAKTLQKAGGGVIVPPENPRRLTDAVISLLHSNPEKLDHMGRCNREYAELNFDNTKILIAHDEFLAEIVQNYSF
jgi:colanic acid biosynthesis glycosyl transferase WcaI